MLNKLKYELFISWSYSSDINQHNLLGVSELKAVGPPILTMLIWQNTEHQPQAAHLIRKPQRYTAQIMFEPCKPPERSKRSKKIGCQGKGGI